MGRIAKLARIIGALGGVGVVAWAMRDRFVSIAVPREPIPPAFRAAPAPSSVPAPASAPTNADLTRVKGIGPVFAERLKSAGITSFEDLAAATAADLAAIVEVSEARVSGWAIQAATLTTE